MVEIIKALITKNTEERKIFVLDRETALALQRKRYIEPIVKANTINKIYQKNIHKRDIEIQILKNERKPFLKYLLTIFMDC